MIFYFLLIRNNNSGSGSRKNSGSNRNWNTGQKINFLQGCGSGSRRENFSNKNRKKINGKAGGRHDLVPITDNVKRQLRFWLVILNATSGLASIPAVGLGAPHGPGNSLRMLRAARQATSVRVAAVCPGTGGFSCLGAGRLTLG